jgi:hypothetical protein
MTPGEVKSLNDLAMAHGGQLTINPHTGLPEAGFLSSILPMVAGMALGPAGFGLFESAMAAGLGVGALTGIATGSLSKGLMAGMGAYGGAGLGDALAKTGMEQATQAELAKNQAYDVARTAATPQALGFGDVATKGLPANLSQADYVKSVLDASKPAADIANATNTNTLVNSGYGGPDYVTSTMGNKINTMGQGISSLGSEAGRSSFMNNIGGGMGLAKYGLAAAAPIISNAMQPKTQMPIDTDKDMGQRYTYSPNKVQGPYTASPTGVEQRYFNPTYTPIGSDQARNIYGFADGGVATATPMPGEKPSYQYDPMKQLFAKIESIPSDDQNKQKVETQAQIEHSSGGKNANSYSPPGDPSGFHTPGELASNRAMFLPTVLNLLTPFPIKLAMDALGVSPFGSTSSGGVSKSSGSPMAGVSFKGDVGQVANAVTTGNLAAAAGGSGGMGNVGIGNGATASGVGTGIGSVGSSGGGLKDGGLSEAHYNLGGYSDGGRLLRGPGDGVSDSIPATIGHKQPARLADGEFVVPARIVSELGNGSTEAGARKLYAMMDRVQSARSKTVGKGNIAKNSKSEKYLPA